MRLSTKKKLALSETEIDRKEKTPRESVSDPYRFLFVSNNSEGKQTRGKKKRRKDLRFDNTKTRMTSNSSSFPPPRSPSVVVASSSSGSRSSSTTTKSHSLPSTSTSNFARSSIGVGGSGPSHASLGSMLSFPTPSLQTQQKIRSRLSISPFSNLSSLSPAPSLNPPPYCSSPPLISPLTPTFPHLPGTTPQEINDVDDDDDEENYPHNLATPVQQSYFVQLSGLFEGEYTINRVEKEERATMEAGLGSNAEETTVRGKRWKGECSSLLYFGGRDQIN